MPIEIALQRVVLLPPRGVEDAAAPLQIRGFRVQLCQFQVLFLVCFDSCGLRRTDRVLLCKKIEKTLILK